MEAARDELAALAAAAQDRHLVAQYVYSRPGKPARTIVGDQRQRRQLAGGRAGGRLGGTADVSMASHGRRAVPVRAAVGRPTESASCVRLGDRRRRDAAPVDPRVQHPFTDWLDVLTDRRAPLAVSPASAPEGVTGTCYSVESTSASLNAPLDVGIYCYDQDGTPTGVRTGAGTLRLAACARPRTGHRAAGRPGGGRPGPARDRGAADPGPVGEPEARERPDLRPVTGAS